MVHRLSEHPYPVAAGRVLKPNRHRNRSDLVKHDSHVSKHSIPGLPGPCPIALDYPRPKFASGILRKSEYGFHTRK